MGVGGLTPALREHAQQQQQCGTPHIIIYHSSPPPPSQAFVAGARQLGLKTGNVPDVSKLIAKVPEGGETREVPAS